MDQYIRDLHFSDYKTIIIGSLNDYNPPIEQTSSKTLSILHVNIWSISKNFDELQALTPTDKKFDCICLSEIWQIEDLSSYSMEGYNKYYNSGNINKNDGVFLYVKKRTRTIHKND